MALKCRINEGYCYIHAGRLNRGRGVIRRVLRDVTRMQSNTADVDASMDEDDGLLLNHTPGRELSDVGCRHCEEHVSKRIEIRGIDTRGDVVVDDNVRVSACRGHRVTK